MDPTMEKNHENDLLADQFIIVLQFEFGIDHRHILYPGVNHSFIWPGDKYNQKAHLDSWDRTLEFFKKNLK